MSKHKKHHAEDKGRYVREMDAETVRTASPRSAGQKRYVQAMKANQITFALGPAGTGKSLLAVNEALAALDRKEVSRIVLTRPVVEAGESLGFLPGDFSQKVEPYIRPLFDHMYYLRGVRTISSLLGGGAIEIAPLAYMRGRSLNSAFVIADECQNMTLAQMKMLLTRFGDECKMVVTGDPTQSDLPGQRSGLLEVKTILSGVPSVAFIELVNGDVIRSPMTKNIIAAFQNHESRKKE